MLMGKERARSFVTQVDGNEMSIADLHLLLPF